MNFNQLPPELITLMATFLNIKEMAQLAIVDKKTYKAVNKAPCSNLGIWSVNRGNRILRPATFEEVSKDTNYQNAEKVKAKDKYNNQLAELNVKKISAESQAKFVNSLADSPCKMVTCVAIPGLVVTTFPISATLVLALNDFFTCSIEGTMALLSGSFILGSALSLGGYCLLLMSYDNDNYFDNKLFTISDELEKHEAQGLQKLYSEIEPPKVISMRQ